VPDAIWLATPAGCLPLQARRRFDRVAVGAQKTLELLTDAERVASARIQCMHVTVSRRAETSLDWHGPRLRVEVHDPDGDLLTAPGFGPGICALVSALTLPTTAKTGVELSLHVADPAALGVFGRARDHVAAALRRAVPEPGSAAQPLTQSTTPRTGGDAPDGASSHIPT
jgi:hypothetical protein